MNSNIYDKHSKTNLLSIISNMKKKDISNMMNIYNNEYTNVINKAIEKNNSNSNIKYNIKDNFKNDDNTKIKDASNKPNVEIEPIIIKKNNLLNKKFKKSLMNNNIYNNI